MWSDLKGLSQSCEVRTVDASCAISCRDDGAAQLTGRAGTSTNPLASISRAEGSWTGAQCARHGGARRLPNTFCALAAMLSLKALHAAWSQL